MSVGTEDLYGDNNENVSNSFLDGISYQEKSKDHSNKRAKTEVYV